MNWSLPRIATHSRESWVFSAVFGCGCELRHPDCVPDQRQDARLARASLPGVRSPCSTPWAREGPPGRHGPTSSKYASRPRLLAVPQVRKRKRLRHGANLSESTVREKPEIGGLSREAATGRASPRFLSPVGSGKRGEPETSLALNLSQETFTMSSGIESS